MTQIIPWGGWHSYLSQVSPMDSPLALQPEEQDLRATIARFSDEKIAPFAAQWDEKEYFPRDLYSEMGALGYLGAIIPEQYGGSGMSLMSGLIIMEEISRGCGGTGLSYGAHAFIGTYNILKMSNEEQRQKYLPPLCSGEKIACFCLTEPGSGSDSMAMATTAKREGDEYILNGSKTFITNAPYADTFLVFARTGEAGAKGISAFILEKDFPGLSVSQPMKKMGMKASPTGEVFFENCRVPAANLLGEENKGAYLAMAGLDMERVLFSGLPIGLMRRAMDISFKYAGERTQFGKPIAAFQLVQDMMARMAMKTHLSTLAAYSACRKLESGERCTLDASYSKLFASEAASEVTSDAVQILGGYGYIREFDVERLMRDAKLVEIGGGTSQIQKLIIARELTQARS